MHLSRRQVLGHANGVEEAEGACKPQSHAVRETEGVRRSCGAQAREHRHSSQAHQGTEGIAKQRARAQHKV